MSDSIGGGASASTPVAEKFSGLLKKILSGEEPGISDRLCSPHFPTFGETREYLNNTMRERIMVMDGAMGSRIQVEYLSEAQFRGDLTDLPEDKQQEGNNDLLNLSSPDLICRLHEEYTAVGSDLITANTFNSNEISQSEYQLSHLAYGMAFMGAQLARHVCRSQYDTYEQICLTCGTLGPTNVTLSVSPSVEDPSFRSAEFPRLVQVYGKSIDGLVNGGVDMLMIETVFDTLNAKAAIVAYLSKFQDLPIEDRIPLLISGTITDQSGRTLSGQTIEAFYTSISHAEPFAVGINCSLGPSQMRPYIESLSKLAVNRYISCHPNAGLPNEMGGYDETPELFAEKVKEYMDEGLVNIVGGCCGTTWEHIAPLVEYSKTQVKPRFTYDTAPNSDGRKPFIICGLEPLNLTPDIGFMNIGERCNVAGSAQFKRLIVDGDYAKALEVAKAQVQAGAMALDINFDDGLLDGVQCMDKFCKLIATEPDIARVPLVIDSSKFEVLERGLQCCQGKCIANSISLKEGTDTFIKRLRTLRQLGAAVIIMAFDENGQAVTCQRKIEVATRAYDLCMRNKFPPEDIIFDLNILTIATGMVEHNAYAEEFLRALPSVRQQCPHCRTSGGLSNLSFSFRGLSTLREAMHSVFLYYAIQAGLDMAIVNAAALIPDSSIPPDLGVLIQRVILNTIGHEQSDNQMDDVDRLLHVAKCMQEGKEVEILPARGGAISVKASPQPSWDETTPIVSTQATIMSRQTSAVSRQPTAVSRQGTPTTLVVAPIDILKISKMPDTDAMASARSALDTGRSAMDSARSAIDTGRSAMDSPRRESTALAPDDPSRRQSTTIGLPSGSPRRDSSALEEPTSARRSTKSPRGSVADISVLYGYNSEVLQDLFVQKEDSNDLSKLPKKIVFLANNRRRSAAEDDTWRELPTEERIVQALVRGVDTYIEADVEEMRVKLGSALGTIEGPLMKGMGVVGDLFGSGKMFLPQVIKTARVMKKAVNYLTPYVEKERAKDTELPSARSSSAGTIILATVRGDVHDIGKNLVGVVLGCNKFNVIDLGVMVPCETIIKTAIDNRADAIGLSGLITPSLDEMIHVAREMKRAGLQIPLLIGGATTSPIHTAVKIAPEYPHGVVHVADASRAPVVLQTLLSKRKTNFLASIDAEYRRIREEHMNPAANRKFVPFQNACSHRLIVTPKVPKPLFVGAQHWMDIPLAVVKPYIDWVPFFQVFQLRGRHPNRDYPDILKDSKVGGEAARLFREASEIIDILGETKELRLTAGVGIFPAQSTEDGDILVEHPTSYVGTRADEIESEYGPTYLYPLENYKKLKVGKAVTTSRLFGLRQQEVTEKNQKVFLNFSDFILPKSSGQQDYVAMFVCTSGLGYRTIAGEFDARGDVDKKIILSAVCDRLAEAMAEFLHCVIRREMWGFGQNENLDIKDMICAKYQGIRPAPGYPIQPDLREAQTILNILAAFKLGIVLDRESYMMIPESSVSALVFPHPQSKYFSVEKLQFDQVLEYAKRRIRNTKGLKVTTESLKYELRETHKWLQQYLAYNPDNVTIPAVQEDHNDQSSFSSSESESESSSSASTLS